jgi:DNA-binding NtrC family response regulator
MLAEHFLHKYAEVNGVPFRPVSARTRVKLHAHEWRGNVRELENTMHRAILLTRGEEVEPEAIMLTSTMSAASPSGETAAGDIASDGAGDDRGDMRGLVGRTVSEVERDLIIDTVQHCLGNRTHAANILGISIRTLRNKLKQYADEGVRVPLHGDTDRAIA